MTRSRHQNGGVIFDKRTNLWYYRKRVSLPDGKRQSILTQIGTLAQYPTKAKAVKASLPIIIAGKAKPKVVKPVVARKEKITFEIAAQRYMDEKMPTHHTTAAEYKNYLRYSIAKWGKVELSAIEPMEVWKWVNGLTHPKTGQPLAGKTKGHIKSKMHLVYEFAMLAGDYPITRNPMELVTVKGASKVVTRKRVLTYEEWGRFIGFVTAEPQRTAVITCMCLGIRREEVWGLKWSDFDFEKGTVQIQRGIIGGRIGPVKTDASEAALPLDEYLVALLLSWRSKSQFAKDTDWVWASPYSAGEMPLYFNAVQRDYIIPASVKAGLGKIGWHTLRHTYRNWMSAAGTPLDVQRDLMRHSNISMTADYGKGVVQAMREANSQVVRMVRPSAVQ